MPGDVMLDGLLSPDAGMSGLWNLLFSWGGPEYTATSALRETLWDWSLLDKSEYYEYEVPVFIFQGEHDWQTPTTLVRDWFARIEAPHKEYIPFEQSAHYVVPEEPAKYIYSLIDRVRPFAVVD